MRYTEEMLRQACATVFRETGVGFAEGTVQQQVVQASMLAFARGIQSGFEGVLRQAADDIVVTGSLQFDGRPLLPPKTGEVLSVVRSLGATLADHHGVGIPGLAGVMTGLAGLEPAIGMRMRDGEVFLDDELAAPASEAIEEAVKACAELPTSFASERQRIDQLISVALSMRNRLDAQALQAAARRWDDEAARMTP